MESTSEPKVRPVATATKRSHKRKVPLPDPEIRKTVDDPIIEDIHPSDEFGEDASSDSSHWSNDEEDEFKVTRPAAFETSRKRRWRSRISSKGHRRGHGNGSTSSVAMRDPRKPSDRGSDIGRTRGPRTLEGCRGTAASETYAAESSRGRAI